MDYIKNIIYLGMILLSPQLFAATSMSNVQATATLTASCYLTVGTLVLSTNNMASTTIGYKCSKGVIGTMSLSQGSSGNYIKREMVGKSGNTDKLEYNVYIDNTLATVFGDGTQSSETRLLPESKGSASIVALFGKREPNQYPTPDTYKDQLVISITY